MLWRKWLIYSLWRWFLSLLFFVLWVRDEGTEERRLKQFFAVPVEVRLVCWEGRVFTERCHCCIINGLVCACYLCVSIHILHPTSIPDHTSVYIYKCVCLDIGKRQTKINACMAWMCMSTSLHTFGIIGLFWRTVWTGCGSHDFSSAGVQHCNVRKIEHRLYPNAIVCHLFGIVTWPNIFANTSKVYIRAVESACIRHLKYCMLFIFM